MIDDPLPGAVPLDCFIKSDRIPLAESLVPLALQDLDIEGAEE